MVKIFAAKVPAPVTIAAQAETSQRLLKWSYLALHPEETELPPVQRTERGKPFFPSRPGCHFNLSHSGEWVVCALANKPVGIDLQEEHPLRANVARRFTQEEQEFLQTQPPAVFFDLWVKKEARLKAQGIGLTVPLNSISVLPLSANQENDYVNQLVEFPASGYHLAVCLKDAKECPVLLSLEMVNFS